MSVQLAPLASALGFTEAPDVIIRKLQNFYAELEQEIDSKTKVLSLPCHKGCDACCHESVFLSAPEFLLVVEQLSSEYSAEEQRQLLAEMLGLAAHYADELELLEQLAPGPERDEVAARIKFRCPFLSKEGACRVYAGRELNARTFGRSWDSHNNQSYGCMLTHERLAVLPLASNTLPDARAARRRLVALLPQTALVHVYPWWFKTYQRFL